MPNQTKTTKREGFEHLAADAGWECSRRDDMTVFARDGWHIEAGWLDDRNVLARLAITDPYGQPVRSMNWLDDRGDIDSELMVQLKSPGPLRAQQVSLETSVNGLLYLLDTMEPDRKYTVEFFRDLLLGCVEEAS